MKSVLIVDDEKDIGTLMSLILKSLGFSVNLATDSLSASSLLENNQFDYIFLDLNLGNSNGLDLIPKIREEQKRAVLHVISAYGDSTTRQKVKEAGVSNFIQKPFRRKEIVEAVDKFS